MFSQAGSVQLAASDMAVLTDPAWLASFMGTMPAMFAHGVAGYTDDRLADGPGWGSFDVSTITCPVIVLHGDGDAIVPVAHAHHTAAIVPGAKLRVCPGLGHFSIFSELVPEVAAMLGTSSS
jgi:pimeloyl-ACP methyl ester carboxylesterase